MAATALTIGTYNNVMDGQKSPHLGSIRRTRIFKRALSSSEVSYLYNLLAPKLRGSPVQTREFWVQASPSPSAPLATLRSPRSNYADGTAPSQAVIRGSFNLTQTYICRFTAGKSGQDLAVSKPANVSCSSPNHCLPSYGDTLTCTTPVWRYGFARATLSVLALNVTSDIVPGTVFEASAWLPLWQRMCYSSTCGFSVAPRGLPSWWTTDASHRMNPFIIGTFTRFTFTTSSRLFLFDRDAQSMTRVSSFGGYDGGCTADTCILGMKTCRAGPSLGLKCSSPADCQGYDCSTLQALGASSIMHFTDGNKHYLAAANYWDGGTTFVRSSLFQLDPASDNVTLVQDFACNSARKMLMVSFANKSIVFATSHLQPSLIIPWDSQAPSPLIEGAAYSLETVGATAAVVFSTFATPSTAPYTYLAVSSWPVNGSSSTRGSSLYVLGNAYNATHTALWGGKLVRHVAEHVGQPVCAVLVSTFDVSNAQDVVHFVVRDRRYLVFASNSPTSQSAVYSSSVTSDPPVFQLQQRIATVRATSMVFFQSRGDPYMIITQAERQSLVLGWDYTTQQFRSVSDVTGAQFFPTQLSQSAMYFEGAADNEHILFGSYRGVPKGATDETVHVASLLMRSRREKVSMSWPISVTVSKTHVYVAAHDSRKIAIFRRNEQTGTVVQADGDSFTTQWTDHPVTDDDPPPSSGVLGKEAYGYPLNGIRTIVLSPDFAHLYAVSMGDGCVIVFDVDKQTGRLNVSQIVDASTIPMLGGATGVALGGVNASSVYVVSGQEHAVVLFERNRSTGHLTFVDDLRDGERFVTSFRDDTNDTLPYMNVSDPGYDASWDNGRYPMRLGGNGYKWSNTARDSAHYLVDNVVHLAVASADMDPYPETSTQGAVMVYVWDEVKATFHFRQVLAENTAASAVAFMTRSSKDEVHFYLVVANGLRFGADQPAPINVYRYNKTSGMYDMFQSLGVGSGMFPNSISTFAITSFVEGGSRQFLVVAYTWDSQASYAKESHVYEWLDNEVGIESPPVVRTGFYRNRLKQDKSGREDAITLSTRGAMEVDYVEMVVDVTDLTKSIRLLAFASFEQPSSVDVYRVLGGTSEFLSISINLIQNIPTLGQAHGLDIFPIANDFFMAIANRQLKPTYPDGDVLAYDLVSWYYVSAHYIYTYIHTYIPHMCLPKYVEYPSIFENVWDVGYLHATEKLT